MNLEKFEVNKIFMNNTNNNRDNRNNFKPGKKPFSRDGGGYKSNDRYNDRNDRNDRGERKEWNNRGDRNFQRDRSQRSYGDNNYKKNDGGYNKFKKYDNRDDKFNKDNRNNRDYKEKKPPFKKFDRADKPDRFNKFNKSDKTDNFKKFDKFERKYDKPDKFNKFEKKPKITVRDVPSVPNNIVSSVEQEDSGMVYGRKAVIELLKSDKSIDKLFVQSGQKEGSITMIFAEAVKKSIPIIEVEKNKLDSMINNSAHQGVIALASEKEYCSVEDILQVAEDRNEKPFILIADKIMDPHNLGAIIRTAECAGVHGIIIPKRNAAGVSPIVAKTSAGASIHMAIAKVSNIANTIEELKEKGVWVFSSSSDLPDSGDMSESTAKDYSDADYDIPLVLVVGNEGEGLSSIIIQKSDFLVRIPMLGKIESLNVSCASAVLMYEVARQRKNK